MDEGVPGELKGGRHEAACRSRCRRVSFRRPRAGAGAPAAYRRPQHPEPNTPRSAADFPDYQAGLAEHNLVDGRTVVVEYHWAEGGPERLRALAQMLGSRTGDVDVIVTAGPQAVRALLATGTKIPVVVAVIGDPVADGIAKTLARPGGTITGLSMVNNELEGKRLDILRAAVPSVGKVMLLLDRSMNGEGVATVESIARTLGVELVMAEVSETSDLQPAFDGAVSRRRQRPGDHGVAVPEFPARPGDRARQRPVTCRRCIPRSIAPARGRADVLRAELR